MDLRETIKQLFEREVNREKRNKEIFPAYSKVAMEERIKFIEKLEKNVLAELTNYKLIPLEKWLAIVELIKNRPSWEWMKDNLDKLEDIELAFRKIEAKVAELEVEK